MTLGQALASAAAQGLDRLDAQLLLLHALARPQSDRAWLLAHDDEEIGAEQERVYRQLRDRRAGGEPLAYIVGRKEFFGLQFLVDRRVLVPRPETEILVEWALEILARRPGPGPGSTGSRIAGLARNDKPSIIDLGTGSGAIALAIKNSWPDGVVEAVDVSADALVVAAANARALGLDIGLRHSSWLTGTTGRYDLIVSNPPYIAEHDPHLEGLVHEPLAALAAGPQGLDDLRAITSQAGAHLKAGGWLLLEHGWDQAEGARALFRAAGFCGVGSRRDLAGIERCTGGQWLELG
ncbi:MAG: hemK [Ramlibacter sp.]|nr:hemK [Ramlibacter sp.]